MYCAVGLCKALAEKVIRPNGGWVDESDYDQFCSPMTKNEGVYAYAVGFFMPDGKKFCIDEVFDTGVKATSYVHILNGGD